MRSQVDRDEVTVTIATSVVLVLMTLLAGWAVIALLDRMTNLPEVAIRGAIMLVVAAAAWVSGSYLWRHRRP